MYESTSFLVKKKTEMSAIKLDKQIYISMTEYLHINLHWNACNRIKHSR